MEQLKTIKEQLVAQVLGQMGDLKRVDTKELGEVIDMIKDLAETMYYCSITEAMEQSSEQGEDKKNTYYYMEKYLPYYPDRDYDYYNKGKMYYGDRMYYGNGGNSSSSGGSSGNGGNSSSGNSGTNYYEERYPISFKDEREGRSGTKRKMYMESKQTHQDTSKKIQELEEYVKDLTSDMMEMIQDASPEEKAVLQKKVNTLAAKLQNV